MRARDPARVEVRVKVRIRERAYGRFEGHVGSLGGSEATFLVQDVTSDDSFRGKAAAELCDAERFAAPHEIFRDE